MKAESRDAKIRQRVLYIRSMLIAAGPIAIMAVPGSRAPGITDNPRPYTVAEIWVTAIICVMSFLSIIHWSLALEVKD